METYKLIRSRRKTISLELRGGELIVRAPYRVTKKEADAVVLKHTDWIKKQRLKAQAREELRRAQPRLSEEELLDLKRRAAEYIPARVRYYADRMGAQYGRITLRCQKTRWGSCSAKKNLNFNILLMLTPPEVIDSVVVHELCHLWEMNHSPRFYQRVYAAFPDYDRWNRWLKDNGDNILAGAGLR